MANTVKKLGKVVDTNVLIDYYDKLEEMCKEGEVFIDAEGQDFQTDYIILAEVLQELDALEKESRDKGLKYGIRKAKRSLQNIVDNPDDYPYIKFIHNDEVSEVNDQYVDNILLEVLGELVRDGIYDEVSLLTEDTILYVRARVLGFSSTLLESNKRKETYRELRYNPVINLNPVDHPGAIAAIYQDNRLPSTIEMVNGQYLEIEDTAGTIHDQYCYVEGELFKVRANTMRVKDFTNVKPKNSRQNLLLDLLDDKSRPVKLVTGAQGGGKTYLTLLYAYKKYLEEQKRIIWMRPTVYVKGSQDLGALPGDLDEKLEVMYAPAKDILTEGVVLNLVEDGGFCVEHLGFDRGRSFANATILVPECQNLTEDNVHFILGRVGENTEIIFDGDYMQTDIGQPTGLLALDNKLAGNELFGKVELPETVRSEVAKLTKLFEQ